MPITVPGGGGNEATPLVISPVGASLAGAAWPSANLGIFVKFRLAKGRTVNGILVSNVAPGSGQNAIVGLYSSDGTTLTQMVLSAGTALAGSNAGQRIPFTATRQASASLDYFAFIALDNVTATVMRSTFVSGTVVGPLGLDISYATATAYVSPPSTFTISGAAGATSGFMPYLAIY